MMNDCRLRIRVKFPDGIREVPGYYQEVEQPFSFPDLRPGSRTLGLGYAMTKAVPDSYPGWRFEEIVGDIDGVSWIAIED